MISSIVMACQRGAPDTLVCCNQRGTGGASSSGGSDAGSAAPPASTRFRRAEGCARDYQVSGSPVRDAAELGRRCALGMAPLAPDAVVVDANAEGVGEASFQLAAPGGCVRAAAVGRTGGVALSLLDASGDVVASAWSNEALVVVPVDGTVCVREAGSYRASIRTTPPHAGESVAIQLWQAKRPTTESSE